MINVLIAGAGKIGSAIARFLCNTNDYTVYITDTDIAKARSNIGDFKIPHFHLLEHDILEQEKTQALIQKHDITALISCLPYTCNIPLSKLVAETDLHYFGLTEDIASVEQIATIAANSKKAFVPQCGLAPGIINIIANDLMKNFLKIDTVKLRCGALPKNTANPLKYALTWSTDGLINEYGNTCYGIVNGKKTVLFPLEDLEELQIDDAHYETFNTSGGIGTLVESYLGKVKELTYKSIRYVGHCEKMKFLMQGLKLNEDRATLKKILENAIPTTTKDRVILYVSVSGEKNKDFIQESYVKNFFPTTIAGVKYSAMQTTTASGACAVIDTVLNNVKAFHGFIKQEAFDFSKIKENRFGKYFADEENENTQKIEH